MFAERPSPAAERVRNFHCGSAPIEPNLLPVSASAPRSATQPPLRVRAACCRAPIGDLGFLGRGADRVDQDGAAAADLLAGAFDQALEVIVIKRRGLLRPGRQLAVDADLRQRDALAFGVVFPLAAFRDLAGFLGGGEQIPRRRSVRVCRTIASSSSSLVLDLPGIELDVLDLVADRQHLVDAGGLGKRDAGAIVGGELGHATSTSCRPMPRWVRTSKPDLLQAVEIADQLVEHLDRVARAHAPDLRDQPLVADAIRLGLGRAWRSARRARHDAHRWPLKADLLGRSSAHRGLPAASAAPAARRELG
jgi:hypothetical protein